MTKSLSSSLAPPLSRGRVLVHGHPETDPRVAFFPVELQPVFREVKGPPERPPRYVQAPYFFAVVDIERDYVFSVVTGDYELVTNEAAMRHAEEAFKALFRTVDFANHMEVLHVEMPSTRSSCQIDLMHREYHTQLWDREVHVPYLRVANSYNRTRALHFDLGFVRAADGGCAIFDTITVNYKKAHTQKDLGRGIKFVADGTQIADLMERFVRAMTDLRRIKVPMRLGPALILRALGELPKSAKRKGGTDKGAAKRASDAFKARIMGNFHECVDAHGPNAYAIYVAASALATFPPGELVIPGGPGTLQKRVGDWVEEFRREAGRPGFDLETYVARERTALDGP